MKWRVVAGATQVLMGPFRELRMKKTALGGIKDDNDTRHVEIKDDNDTRHVELRMTMTRASWSDTGGDRSF